MEDAQQEHDLARMRKKPRLAKNSKQKLEALLNKKRMTQPSQIAYDPVSSIVRNHPSLTEERAAEIIKAYGF